MILPKFSIRLVVKIALAIIILVFMLLIFLYKPAKKIDKRNISSLPAKETESQKPSEEAPKKESIKPLVSILTKGNVFIEVTVDEKLIFQNIIIEGTKESWVAKKKLKIKISNPSLVSLEIGNQIIPTSNQKKPASYIITSEGFEVLK